MCSVSGSGLVSQVGFFSPSGMELGCEAFGGMRLEGGAFLIRALIRKSLPCGDKNTWQKQLEGEGVCFWPTVHHGREAGVKAVFRLHIWDHQKAEREHRAGAGLDYVSQG